jgi:alanyl aminopeptidase
MGILERRTALEAEPADREQAWQWLRAHWDTLLPRMREDEKVALFEIAGVWCDAAHRAEAAAFLGPRAAQVEGGPRALANALEKIDVCVAEQALNRDAIRAFLARR